MAEKPDIERIRETYTDDFNGMAIDGSVIHLCDYALALEAQLKEVKARNEKLEAFVELASWRRKVFEAFDRCSELTREAFIELNESMDAAAEQFDTALTALEESDHE